MARKSRKQERPEPNRRRDIADSYDKEQVRKETKERSLTVQALVNHPYFANIVVVRSSAA